MYQVYQLFIDLAILTKYQGDMIDNIELNFQNTLDYVEEAEKKLIAAKKSHMQSKKVSNIYFVFHK